MYAQDYSNKLSLYNNLGHMIQKIPVGIQNISVSKFVRDESIIVIDSNGNYIPFTYVPELTSNIINIKDSVVTKNNKQITGKILTLNDKVVSLLVGDQLTTVRNYDSISTFNNINGIKPKIIVEKFSTPITVSYLLSNIKWKCIGTGVIDNYSNVMNLKISGYITNETDSNIVGELSLINGKINDNYSSNSKVFARALVDDDKEILLEDYRRFNLGERLLQEKNIIILSVMSLDVQKIYIHNTSNEPDYKIVQYGYNFLSTSYIPKCNVNFYSIDRDIELDSYLGSSIIEETQGGETVEIILGESSTLKCKSNVIQTNVELLNDSKWNRITEEISVEIINYNTYDCYLYIRHNINNKKIVEVISEDIKQYDKKNGSIQWLLKLPPKIREEPIKWFLKFKVITEGLVES